MTAVGHDHRGRKAGRAEQKEVGSEPDNQPPEHSMGSDNSSVGRLSAVPRDQAPVKNWGADESHQLAARDSRCRRQRAIAAWRASSERLEGEILRERASLPSREIYR